MAISDDDIKGFRCILMYDDETINDAVAQYSKTPDAAEWWTLVIDLGGRFAVTSFAAVTAHIKQDQKVFLESSLGKVAGTFKPVDIVAEQSSSDLADVKRKAGETPSQTAVVVDRGEFKGIISAGATRGGLFGSELVKLAGQYADLPTTGLLSPRRKAAIEAKKNKQ
jgi:hypothetical protein